MLLYKRKPTMTERLPLGDTCEKVRDLCPASWSQWAVIILILQAWIQLPCPDAKDWQGPVLKFFYNYGCMAFTGSYSSSSPAQGDDRRMWWLWHSHESRSGPWMRWSCSRISWRIFKYALPWLCVNILAPRSTELDNNLTKPWPPFSW